jgi:hypothetical protein
MSRTEKEVIDLLEENFPDSSEEIDKIYRPLEKEDPDAVVKICIKFEERVKVDNEIDVMIQKRKEIWARIEKLLTIKDDEGLAKAVIGMKLDESDELDDEIAHLHARRKHILKHIENLVKKIPEPKKRDKTKGRKTFRPAY